jgi:predicted nucleotidyltransferase component of viral defense system
MILQSEILKLSEQCGVLPDTIDKDWVLGHFLAELYQTGWAQQYLVFKGGTCLKKCYFNDYRFSEDLDFTLINLDFAITNQLIQSVCDIITIKTGILFSIPKVEPIVWNNHQVGYITFLHFWGANHKRNQQPPVYSRWQTSIKIEIIYYELLVNSPEHRILLSQYSDKLIFKLITIPCYSLLEVVTEKFRALLQRSYPAPRDYYDLWKLLQNDDLVDKDKIGSIFRQKAQFKHIEFHGYTDFFETDQLKRVKQAWKNSLQNHLKDNTLPDYEKVITDLNVICAKIKWI